jgi:hypothetical protein
MHVDATGMDPAIHKQSVGCTHLVLFISLVRATFANEYSLPELPEARAVLPNVWIGTVVPHFALDMIERGLQVWVARL